MLAWLDQDDADAGPRSAALGTERLCLVTREVKPVSGMIRFVVAPDGEVVADLKRRLPGRGVWITATRQALAEAVKRGAFRRGFRANAKVPADLVERVDERLMRHVLDALSIAHKAGRVTAGFAKVEAAVAGGSAVAVVHAADAGDDGVRKIAARAAHREPNSLEIPRIRAFTSAQLDLALGRSNVVHAALLVGPASDTFLSRWRNLDRFRMGHPGGGAMAFGSKRE